MQQVLTKAGVEAMFKGGLNGSPTKCTIKGRYNTHVFKFPGVFLQSETHVDPLLIAQEKKSRATVVSDLQSYFQNHSPFRHYSIDRPLRRKVEKETSQSRKKGFSLFVVIEQEIPCKTTTMDGNCASIDEKYIQEGLPGGTAMIAIKTSDGKWPEEEDDGNQFVNTTLAAVRVEQNRQDCIEALFCASCFFDMDERAIYPIEVTVSGGLCVELPIDDKELKAKADRLRELIQDLEADIQADMRNENRQPTSRLVKALGLWKIKDDYYRRALYLGLYDGMEKKLESYDSKTNDSRLSDFMGKHGNYRTRIAHPDMGEKIKKQRLNELQTDVLKELRHIYKV